MTASVAIQTLPAAKDDEELVRIVDEVIAYIKSTGLNAMSAPSRRPSRAMIMTS